uniref:Membrane protein n=1 Tax=Bacillus phage KoopaTroopa TaxID=3234046 RepID=A0AB39C7P2_9CAUD
MQVGCTMKEFFRGSLKVVACVGFGYIALYIISYMIVHY